MTASVICYNTKLIPKVVAIVLQMEQENPFTLTVMSVMVMWLIKQLCPHKHPMWFMRSIGQGCLIMPLIPGVVVWLGGVEKGGGGEGESSVQLFNNWRNSRALENSLKEKKKDEERGLQIQNHYFTLNCQEHCSHHCPTQSHCGVCLLQSRSAAVWGCERLFPKASCRSSGAAGL